MTELFDSAAFLKTVTQQPGVYRMYDSSRTVIYVGKAKNLKNRLSSYFRSTLDNEKTRVLVKNIASIDVTVTHTETEALILEHNYIKKYMPRYNVLLRDDKSYPYIVITDHKHPRLGVYRGSKKSKGQFFGPYPSGGAVRESLHLMQKIFPVRQCEDSYYRNRSRPCLQYQLKRCLGPCTNMVSDDEYQQQVELATLFLQGKSQDVIGKMIEKMQQASDRLEFEQAARFRDQIQALRKVSEQQSVTGAGEQLDAIGFAYQNGMACIHVLFIRQGQVLGSRSYFPKVPNASSADEVFTAFISQFYLSGANGRVIPKQILISQALEEQNAISAALSEFAKYKVVLTEKVRADRAGFLRLACTNALSALTSQLSHKSTMLQRFYLLQEALDLEQPIKRIECYDISHTMGEKTVASSVVFNREGPLKSDYRLFNITGITPGDDYAAMKQVLTRRFRDVQALENIPDIVFIDGGLGQLAQAEAVLADFSENFTEKMPLLIGIAKGVTRKAGLESLIMGQTHEELEMAGDSPALHLIQHIRDESHRFAITGHRQRRDKARKQSTLESIAGVGPKRRQAILTYLGGLHEVKKASVDDLARVPGISHELAQKIYDTLHH
ncbi:excinuclease ABC subunit UvrC [Motilimonas sp. 1_MG-2023]|uniref:excinuclease ABC subunit UvrC n=1 Tax=Motilimonas TaxID=1914248 RepID=UPI0026E1CFB4|nr:excinuclease ABC subunit UvrC [Motilimonas sp. 1_MG-2023]MDO6525797.1 excinuclease ABC subunit UvrC [Motilimonas sp. 1_MG-2023]